MKKALLLSILSLITTITVAQNDPAKQYKNTASINPFIFAFGNVQLTYERMLTKTMSVDLEIGAKLPIGVMKINGFDTPSLQTDDFGFKGIVITPTFRWYCSQGIAPQSGFYIGGYYRYRNMSDNVTGNYHSSTTEPDTPVDLDISLNTHTFGCQIGYKLPLGKHMDIDFLIAGPGVTLGQIKTEQNSDLPDEFYTDLQNSLHSNFQFLDSYLQEIVFDKVDKLHSNANLVFPAFRYGFKVGYSF